MSALGEALVVGRGRAVVRSGALLKGIVVPTVLALSILASCARSGGDSTPGREDAPEAPAEVVAAATCVESSGSLGPDASLTGWAGEYTLTMVGGAEGANPASTQGVLSLHEQRENLRRFAGSSWNSIPGVASPLYGTTDVGVEVVGALRVGDLSSADPAAPGVLVIESVTAQGPSILIRFGSDANRRDVLRFDGGFTVLELHEISDDGFSGSWNSGARGPRAAGYFCAERVGA